MKYEEKILVTSKQLKEGMRMPLKKMLILIFLFIVTVVGTLPVSIEQATTEVKGVIDSDTVWTKANSPYTITGNLLVTQGVTLTIEAGTTINLNSFYIMVNGTLAAKGSSTNQITFQGAKFNNGEIIFTEFSTGFSQQTGSGSIMDNAFFNYAVINIEGSSPVISNTKYFASRIHVTEGSPTISNSDIWGGKSVGSEVQYFTPMIIDGGSPMVARNNIHDAETGIEVNGGTPYVYSNNITACHLGVIAVSGTLERNYIENPTNIGNATLKSNTIGIDVIDNSSPIITQNNLGYLHLSSSTNVIASNNWWGTTDSAVIDQKIYDYTDDFNLGKVTYTPFLTATNPQAMPDSNTPIPTPAPTLAPSSSPSSTPNSKTQNPTATPIQPNAGDSEFLGLDWVGVAIVALLAIIVVLLVVVVVFLRRRSVGRL
jgi:hypothetical protein